MSMGNPGEMRAPERTLRGRIFALMQARPGEILRANDIADELGIDQPKKVAQAMQGLYKQGRIDRTGNRAGEYVYTGRPGPVDPRYGRPRPVSEDLKPLTDLVDDDAFKTVGLRPVATAGDGSRICVDDQGTAWKVRVLAEARLI